MPSSDMLATSQSGEKTKITGVLKSVSVIKALAAAGDYAAEDTLSEHATTGTAWIFNGIAASMGGSGYIVKAIASLKTTAITARLTLYLFNALPTANLNDNVANTAPIALDRDKYIGKIDFPALEDLGGRSEALCTPSTSGNLPLAFDCSDVSAALWGILVTRDAITGEAATEDLMIKLVAEQY